MPSHSRAKIAYGVAVALVVSVPVILELLFGSLVDGVVAEGGFPWWLPAFGGTIGQTVTAYLVFVDILAYVVVPVLVFGLGVRYANMTTSQKA